MDSLQDVVDIDVYNHIVNDKSFYGILETTITGIFKYLVIKEHQ
jgi:hypothetical protein